MVANTTATQEPALLAPETAFATLRGRVYIPVLRTKLARDYGIPIRNEQELALVLQTTQQLRAAYEQNLEKRGGDARAQLLARAAHGVGVATSAAGLDVGNEDALAKQAATELSGYDDLALAALSLHAAAAEAQQ